MAGSRLVIQTDDTQLTASLRVILRVLYNRPLAADNGSYPSLCDVYVTLNL